jgi:hypothetical protein
MVCAIALVTGVSAVFVGSLLLRTWLRYGGASGTSHFRRIQILGHAAVGILGVVLVSVHLAAGRDPRWDWTALWCSLLPAPSGDDVPAVVVARLPPSASALPGIQHHGDLAGRGAGGQLRRLLIGGPGR